MFCIKINKNIRMQCPSHLSYRTPKEHFDRLIIASQNCNNNKATNVIGLHFYFYHHFEKILQELIYNITFSIDVKDRISTQVT